MNKSNLVLLILDIATITDGLIIGDEFTELFNNFIYDKYQDNKELFSIIFNIELLDQYINSGQREIISTKNILRLTNKYKTPDDLIKLLEKVGLETDHKLNQIALMLLDYYYEQLNSSMYIQTPYIRILQ